MRLCILEDSLTISYNDGRFGNGSVNLHVIFKHFKNHFINYAKVIQNRNRTIRTYWSINNINISHELTNITYDNVKIYSADFTDMFTNLEHNLIIRNMQQLMNICFKNADKAFVASNGYHVFYTDGDTNKGSYRYYKATDLIYLIDYLLRNSFCIFAGNIFKQTKGVPQGGNFSPLLADLTLSIMEYNYAKCIRFNASKLFIPYRYMDDLLVIHNQSESEVDEQLTEVYRNTLQLKKTHITELSSNYLDLTINIINDKITTALYNKTDDFNFKVIRFPHSDSNISTNNKASVIYTETLRIANTCACFDMFIRRISDMARMLCNSGYSEDFIIASIVKCIYRNKLIGYKYSITNDYGSITRLVRGILSSVLI